jgi:nucleoside-diphosphate-sugar epimerase
MAQVGGMKTLLVTGATSFVGRWLLPRLVGDYRLVCLVRDPSSLAFLPAAEGIRADLSEPGFAGCLPKAADAVLHLAVAAPSLAPDPHYAFQVNCASTLALLEWGRRAGVERFVFTSTGSVYGTSDAPFTEASPPRPADLLGVSKLAAEMLAGLYASAFPAISLRIWRPYGPGQPANFLFPRLASRITRGEPITLHRGGHPRANCVFITELVEVLRRALALDRPMTLNVAHRDVPSIQDICQELELILGRKATYQWVEQGVGDCMADVTLMEQVLDFRPAISWREGLRLTWGTQPT